MSRSSSLVFSVALILASALITGAVLAGEASSVRGVVRDVSGGPMVGATVTASDRLTKQIAGTAVSGADGTYTLSGLEPGEYVVQATLTGFQNEITVAEVLAGAELTVDFTLAPSRFAGEVLVTAQKREQELQEVPIAMQALEGKVLEEANIRDLNDLITFVPGASEGTATTAGKRTYQIRGISQGQADPTVGYYLDDSAFFAYGLFYAPVARTADVQRVEVLRGPQSTLYGNSSMGGTIRYIYNSPNLSSFEANLRSGFSGTANGESGSYVDAVVNLPLVENKLALRLVGSYEDIGGYADIPSAGLDDTNPVTMTNFRTSALWVPTDQLLIKLLYTRNRVDQDGGIWLTSLDPPVSSSVPGNFWNNGYDLFAGTFEYSFDFATLSSTTTYIDLAEDALNNIPFPALPGGMLQLSWSGSGEALNNETRLVSSGDGPFRWLAGAFYSDSENSTPLETNAPDFFPSSTTRTSSESISLFGEASWAFLEDRLIPLIGVRYFEDDRSYFDSLQLTQIEPETFRSVNPRFNLSYLPNDVSTYYLNIAKGFRSGAFNYPAICALHATGGLPCEVAVDSDTLWSYEIGTKQTWAGGQMLFDVALYYQDWRDVRQNVPYFGLGADYQIGDAVVPGIDLQLIYSPVSFSGFTLRATGNWNDAHFTEIDPAIVAASGEQEGNRLPLVPEWTAAVEADYSWRVTTTWKGQATLSYSHLEPQLGSFANGGIEGDSRDLIRARFGFDSGTWGLFLFGNNLLNETGAIYSQAPQGGTPIFTQDYPRQIGIELTYNFH